ncbi:FecI sigma-24 factor [Sphingobium sp. Ant17]|nr:FecI sigma-24 factor [Sphingobium sp. Ant17]
MDLGECSDGELAALALGGRQSAYGALMSRHREAVYRLVRGYIGDTEEAVDVTQQCFMSAFSALARYDGSRPFRLWVTRIAINKCHDWARRRAVRRFLLAAMPIATAEHVADEAVAVDVAISDREELERVIQAIAALPASLKDPLMLRTIEGLSETETAQVLGVSEKAVEMRLYRAREKLAVLLGD